MPSCVYACAIRTAFALVLAVYPQVGIQRRTDYVPGMLGFDPLKLNSRMMREVRSQSGLPTCAASMLLEYSSGRCKEKL